VSDTSVVFNVIGKERVGGVLARVRSLFRSAGQEAQRATGAAAQSTERLDHEIHQVERSLAELNAEFAATGNKELFAKMKRDRSLLTQLKTVRKELGAVSGEADRLGGDADRTGNMLSRLGASAGSSLSSGMNNAGTAMTNLSTNLWNLIPLLLGMAAAAAGAAPAMYLLGGAIGSLPAIIAGAAAAMAVFQLGTSGLSEAWKKATTATSGGAKAARDMTSAHRAVTQAAKEVTRSERDVTDALKQVRQAHLDVADAVQQEHQRRGQLNRDLAGARLDEQDSVQAVTDAQTALNAARANGAPPDEVEDLERAYERAALQLDDTRARLGELTLEQKKAVATGVQGSAQVVAAKDQEAKAVQGVTDAQDRNKDAVQRLADAQKALNTPAGGGGGGGLASPKLAPAAQKFLNVLLGLRPAFEKLRLGVQEKLFAGLADKFKTMATAWLPQLNTSLGRMATTFNGIAGKFMDTAAKPAFITNIAKGVEGVRSAFDKVGRVVAGPLMTAFGQLAGVSKPFVEALGGEVAKVLSDFSAWIDKVSKNGSLDVFFTRATAVMKDTFAMLKDIGSIAGSVMSILFGADQDVTMSPWNTLKVSLDKVAAWFKDPENQKKIQDWINKIKEFGVWLVTDAIPKIERFAKKLESFANRLSNPKQLITDFFNAIKDAAKQSLISMVVDLATLPGRAARALAGLGRAIGPAVTRGMARLGEVIGRAAGAAVRTMVLLPGRIAVALATLPGRVWNVIKGLPDLVRRGGPGMHNAGMDLVRGLWNGIKGMGGWLINNAVAFGSSIVKGFKEGLGIHSPSKVMATQVGHWIPAGIAAGMDSNRQAVVDASSRMSGLIGIGKPRPVAGFSNGALRPAGSPAAASGVATASPAVGPTAGGRTGGVIRFEAGANGALVQAIVKALRYEVRSAGGGSAQALFGKA
jgi:hypothetical protein